MELSEIGSSEAPVTAGGGLTEFRHVVMTSVGSIVNPEQGDHAQPDASHVVILVPSGAYDRRAPFHTDTAQATSATRATVEHHATILKQQHASIRMVGLPGALMTGQGAVVTRGNLLVKESVVEFTAQGRAPDGFLPNAAGGYTMPMRVDRVIAEPCILVKRPWYNNFGHWLVDGASVLALTGALIRSERMKVVIGRFASPKMRAVVMDTIDQLAPGAEILEHPDEEIWRFENLHYVTPPHVPPLFKLPEALRRIRAGFLGTASAPPPTRKIFVSRRNAGNRRLVNEAEIFDLCAARGFELIDPETLTIRAQAALFAQSRAVIGAKGAALTNCLFCAPGTKIMLLSPADFPDPFFWDIAGQIGCDYAEVFGPVLTDKARGLNEFAVEAPLVAAMLDAAAL